MNPLSIGLNVAVLHIASKLFPTGYDAAPDAPSTFKALCEHLDSGKRMLVYSGGCDTSIYADREVNLAARAWHDFCHWRGGFDFSCAGEAAACDMQQQHIRMLYGDTAETRRWCAILEADVIGQRNFYELTGAFVENQRQFVEAYLSGNLVVDMSGGRRKAA